MFNPTWRLYWSLVRARWYLYALGLLTVLGTNLTEVLMPKFVQWTLDLISTGGVESLPVWMQRKTKLQSLHLVLTLMGSMLVVAMILRGAWRQTLARATHIAARELRMQMWERLRWQSLEQLARYPLGDIMNRLAGDLRSARVIFGFTIVLTSDVVFFGVLALGAMFMIDWQITLMVLAVFLLVTRPVMRLAHYEMILHERAQRTLSLLSDVISQCVASIRMQRASAAEAPWQDRLRDQAERYAAHHFRVKRIGQRIFPFGVAPTLCAYVILLTLGVYRLQQGELSIGEFVAMQSLVFLLQVPMFELGDCIAEWQKGIASLRRVCELTSLAAPAGAGYYGAEGPTSLAEPALDFPAGPAVRIQNVSMTLGQRVVLHEIDLQIEAGEHIGISGPIGAGKSTLLEVMAGLQPASQGTITIWGRSIAEWNRHQLAQRVGFVPQAPFLFSGTLRHNLSLDGTFADGEIWQVLRVVDLEKDMVAYSEGLDTVIGEWGITLSGGQRQRFSLARALLRRPQLLLLDDCVSAVDAATEDTIISNLASYLQGTTVIWVAHRLSTLRNTDRQFYLQDGRLSAGARPGPRGQP